MRVPFSNSAIRDESLPVSERIRRKIWGTDTPPGQDDPYVKLDPAERARQEQRREQRREQEEKEKVAQTAQTAQVEASDDNYEPAVTWDGLETVGDIEEEERNRKYNFKAYV